MNFAYGITTVHERFGTTLPRTLESLAVAGFIQPRLFVDGECDIPEELRSYPITQRTPRIRSFGNWWLALLELYLRETHADRYAIFQDDMLCVANLREYLERCPPPKGAYGNLMTFPENLRIAPRKQGWFEATQNGKGAVALVFDNPTVQKLLTSPYFVERVQDDHRGHKAIDGGVVCAAKKVGIKEYCHNPALVRHIGEVSTMNRSRPGRNTGTSFPGEIQLKPPPDPLLRPIAVRKSGRLGLVGFNTANGVGDINRALATWLDIDSWLVRPHPTLTMLEPHPEVDTVICQDGRKVSNWMRAVDAIIFAGAPLYADLMLWAQKLQVKTFCVPLWSEMPLGFRDWVKNVDRFICPTRLCHEQLQPYVPTLLFPWPCDTERYAFKLRDRCDRFVYAHGVGAQRDGKGSGVIRELLRRQPGLPIDVFDDTAADWDCGSKSVTDDREIYRAGDVLLVPYLYDDVPLECLHAAAAGIPVISTEGRPWNELRPWESIRAHESRYVIRRPTPCFEAEPSHLEQICRERLGMEIADESRAQRAWAESRSWSRLGPVLTNVLRGGVTDQDALDTATKEAASIK